MPFQIIRNDITKVKADAIVNTANPLPLIGAGTDEAIHASAGPELLEARRKIGELRPGECAATPAFGLDARYVLHTVSPEWEDGRHGEAALLRRSYDAALALADSLGCRSVAFPLLSAGNNGFPQDLALTIAIRAFTDFLLGHDMQIDLVLFNGRAFGLAGSIFDDLRSYIDENYVQEYSRPGRTEPNIYRRASLRRPRRTDLSEAENAPEPLSEAFDAAECLPSGSFGTELFSIADAGLEDILRYKESSFSEHLQDLLRERGGKDSEVYKRAEVSKQLFSKIMNDADYRPTKSTALQLAIGLELDLPGTQKLLEKAGYALTRSSKADLVVQYYIERGIYNVSFINEALYDCGLPLLKTGLKA